VANKTGWKITGQDNTGTRFAGYMKTFIESVLPPIYKKLLGEYEVNLAPLKGDPNYNPFAKPKRRTWLQRLADHGFIIQLLNMHL
jgi:hypothetical protein